MTRAPLILSVFVFLALFVAACSDPYQSDPATPNESPPAVAALDQAEAAIGELETSVAERDTEIRSLKARIDSDAEARADEIAAIRSELAAASGEDRAAIEARLIEAVARDKALTEAALSNFTTERDKALTEIKAAKSDLDTIRKARDELAAGSPDKPNPTGDVIENTIGTLGGLLPPPFNLIAPLLGVWGFREVRNGRNRSALTALVRAIKKVKERDPDFASALARNGDAIKIELGTTARKVIDPLRAKVGDDPLSAPAPSMAKVTSDIANAIKAVIPSAKPSG